MNRENRKKDNITLFETPVVTANMKIEDKSRIEI